MLHHISLGVTDLQRSAAFYDAVLSALGYVRVWTDSSAIGYGSPGGGDELAIKLRNEGAVPPGPGFHLAFAASSRDAVAAFHRAALAQGGRDNGAPGLRTDKELHRTGSTKFGALVGDGSRIGANAVLAPGALLLPASAVRRTQLCDQDAPHDHDRNPSPRPA